MAIEAIGFVLKYREASFDIPPSIRLTKLSCRELEILPTKVCDAAPIDSVSFVISAGRFVVKSFTLLALSKKFLVLASTFSKNLSDSPSGNIIQVPAVSESDSNFLDAVSE